MQHTQSWVFAQSLNTESRIRWAPPRKPQCATSYCAVHVMPEYGGFVLRQHPKPPSESRLRESTFADPLFSP
jgi:hypothetical protein